MQKLIHFLRYDNTVPIVLGVIFLGATGTYAATNPEAIYEAEQHVLSVDNTYIANTDLGAWTPRVEILGVTEDEESYFVAYRFTTIDNKDYVWQNVVKDEVMTVSKADLGKFRDLGVYVTQQLKQKIDRELARLKETQDIEKKQISQKMVATAYGGIVGKFLDDTTETLPGYEPVVIPPTEPEAVFTEALPPPADVVILDEVPLETLPAPEEGNASSTPPASENASSTPSTPASTGLAIQILGDNPARIPVGGSYSDLGAVATNDDNDDIAIEVFVNGEPVESVTIDTATTSTWTIRYVAEDAGGTKEATRTVEVYAPASASEPEPEVPAETPATTTPETPAPEPVEETAPPSEEPAPAPAEAPAPTEVPTPEPEAPPAPEPEPAPAVPAEESSVPADDAS